MTDTGAYSDVVFGLFRLLSYRFCPRMADMGDARFWRFDAKANYGKLDLVSQHQLNPKRITTQWDDMLRLTCRFASLGTSASDRHHAHPPGR